MKDTQLNKLLNQAKPNQIIRVYNIYIIYFHYENFILNGKITFNFPENTEFVRMKCGNSDKSAAKPNEYTINLNPEL